VQWHDRPRSVYGGRPTAGPGALLVKVERGNQHGIARVTPGPEALAERFRQQACKVG